MKNSRAINALQQQRSKVIDQLRAKDPKAADSLASIRLDWFRLKNVGDDDDVADLYIYDEIMPAYMAEWFGGVSAEGLIQQLNDISANTINVRINSPGGSVFEAIAIYNTLVSHSATINVYVDALAASAASVIAMAGDKVTMMVGSQIMIHDALGIEMGNAAEMREFADFLDKQSDNIASIYANKAGGDIKDWRALMLAETWMFADEAVTLGLADEIYSRPTAQEDENAPDEEEEASEEDSPEETENDKPVENLMNIRHRLTNRGFNYAGRRRAPDPTTETVSDKEIDNFINTLSTLLERK